MSAGFSTQGFVDDITRWRQGVPNRAPAYHRLLQEAAAILAGSTRESADLAARLQEAWAARAFRIFYERPLLLIAALRMDALAEGTGHPLWPALAAAAPDPDAVTRGALLEALTRDSVWASLRTKFVQTNETSRALAWLWPARIIGCDDGKRALAVAEAGTAAGLNLIGDRLPALWKDAAGAPLPIARTLHTLARIGIDQHPLDVSRDDDANWLRACVWVGEHERIARLEAAIAAFRTANVQIERGDITTVPDTLRALSEEQRERSVVLAFQTIVRDYLEATTRAAYEHDMRRWLEDAPVASAVWIEIELVAADPLKPVPIVAHARDVGGVAEILLGTTGYHPAVVDVNAAGVEHLARIFA